MKNRYAIPIIVIVIGIIAIPTIERIVDVPAVLKKFNINLGQENISKGECSDLAPGYYDITADSSDNTIGFYIIGEKTIYMNVSSEYINSITGCKGDFEFTPTNYKEINFLDQDEFELNPGYYQVGENLSPGKYMIDGILDSGEEIHIQIISGEGDLESWNNVYFDKSNKPGEINITKNDKIHVMIYKKGLFGSEEIVNKKISFKKI